MTLSLFLQLLAALAAMIACSCAVFVARRAAQWRKVDHMDHQIKNLTQKQVTSDHRLTVIETRLENVATKADIAGIVSDINGIRGVVQTVCHGVERIEQFLMERRA